MDFQHLNLIASAAFGLEGLAADELRMMGFRDARGMNGGAAFTGSVEDAFLANLRLRCADRVLMLLAERRVTTFDELFRLAGEVPWEELMPFDARILVTGRCVRSRLMSVRDCQAITKRSVIARLEQHTHRTRFPETGAPYGIDVAIHGDIARITLNLSGEALNRRGYRTWNGEAPLRETLAAALVAASPWRPGMALHDPCCGTGTIPIEAAWRAGHRAPGLTRSFAMEAFSFADKAALDAIRERTTGEYEPERISGIGGSDKDPEALELARRHLRQAGLEARVTLAEQPLETLQLQAERGVFLCNPPYGERMSDQEACRRLYRELRLLKARHPGWALCAISSDPAFEKAYGRRADKKRRFYNGRLECEFYIYQA